jgi:hypothetical protein
MTIQDYPVTFAELEPHFDHFEKVCGVSGVAGNLRGQIKAGGNPFEGGVGVAAGRGAQRCYPGCAAGLERAMPIARPLKIRAPISEAAAAARAP